MICIVILTFASVIFLVIPAKVGIYPEKIMKYPCVYMITNTKRGTLYTGVTSNIMQRTYQHQIHQSDGFTDTYNCTVLVYYEFHASMNEAITREKQIKKWKREWKMNLIESINPDWRDLYDELIASYPY